MTCPATELQRGAAYLAHRCRDDDQFRLAAIDEFESVEDMVRCLATVAFCAVEGLAAATDRGPAEVLAGMAVAAAQHVADEHPEMVR